MNSKNYKQIVILSGKGGTGKTSVALALSGIAKNKIIVDADVDAANMHIILKHKINLTVDYSGGKKAEIDKSKCTKCGLCEDVCRFDAISNFIIDKASCEGCGFCYRVCPENAIKFKLVKSGEYYNSSLQDNSEFYFARLMAGEGNSGKLVSKLKEEALNHLNENTEWIIVDGSPGIGCPVNASLSGADFVLIVIEPTLSGFHDFKRLAGLLKIFKIPSGAIINKYNLNIDLAGKIENYLMDEKIVLLGKIPFDSNFTKAIRELKSITDFEESYLPLFNNILNKIKSLINKKGVKNETGSYINR